MVEKTLDTVPEDERRFAENMKMARENRGWTQTELARRMVEAGWGNYTQMTVSRTEKYERPLRLGEARALAEVLDSHIEEMILPTTVKEELDDLRSAIESMTEFQNGVDAAVKGYIMARQVLKLQISAVEHSTNDDVASSVRQELLSLGREMVDISPEQAVRGAILGQALEDGWFPGEVADGQYSEEA
ncbi:helix-turn-helix transcriptional regulator [Arthrobacter sp. efr-133-TYG-104]|uniref:helix-turn-helix transcriptional regulator n=1 Tax=Arthrobacter sp. efr-133-TYG-104 TaxID=3040324 RepID=UPI00254FBE64|nr:helix-turn-helix transcriptional regulator [Arthrobacter sp. efr-133-TYG-104]